MTTTMSQLSTAYTEATNNHDREAFISLFSADAIVNDAGRELRGIPAIRAWSDHDIFDAQVTLEVLRVAESDDEVTITTVVDGNFDKTGLPHPLLIDHQIMKENDKIARLTCRLATPSP